MARCPDCNKFVGFEEADPEVEDPKYNEGSVTVEARIVNACADCGSELAEATFSMEGNMEVPKKHSAPAEGDSLHEITAEVESSERTSRSGYFKKGVFVPAGGRYAKTFYGVAVEVKVSCSCRGWEETITLEDEIQASDMDSLV